ncbi:MAG: SAM-dependent methyltransferase [Bryobacterales bacterium]|nr:SAM-dependent methyltransferase [Bryobacterales bacterium]
MSPLTEILRAEIDRDGPISFHRFMETALYHPEHGYYRRARDPFGRSGDFYTAEQIQPVFGRLMAGLVRSLRREMGEPADFTVVELGAGRGEMAEAFSGFQYVPVEWGRAQLPERITGLVFANEFFDALPVHVVQWRRGRFHEMLVGFDGARFVWVDGSRVPAEVAGYLRRYTGPREEGMILEVNLDALAWIDAIAQRLERGYLLAIDYGYTAAELVRFPRGTLMTYRSHQASPDALADPGGRDITAHVNFSALEDRARRRGFVPIRGERLAQTLMAIGEPDEFASVLAAAGEKEAIALRLQLKTLVFGMGETFRTLLAGRGTPGGQ